MPWRRPDTRLNQFLRIARLLAGQLDFPSAIRAVAAEIAEIVPYDHLDVCIVRSDGMVHTVYETGIETAWGSASQAPVARSPIRSLLLGEVDHILTGDATRDPRFRFPGASTWPILEHDLRARVHVPMIVHGEVIGALSCSRHAQGAYGSADLRNCRHIAEILAPYVFALRAAEDARRSAIVEAEARAREAGLRQGALQLTEALEAERQRIGMDLHDQTLAELTRLARRLEQLARAPAVGPPDLAALLASLQASMAGLRQIIEEAKPTVLELFGFRDAVENQLDRAVRDSGQAIATRVMDSTGGVLERLPGPVAMTLLRIVQEAVNNAVSHAGARSLAVGLAVAGDALVLTVADDGRGLGPARRRGAGIEIMRTRARLVGAGFDIGPGPGRTGTEVRVELPLARIEPAEDRDALGEAS